MGASGRWKGLEQVRLCEVLSGFSSSTVTGIRMVIGCQDASPKVRFRILHSCDPWGYHASLKAVARLTWTCYSVLGKDRSIPLHINH